MAALEQAAGVVLGLLVLVDIFLFVLYARTHTGLISSYLAHRLWRLFVRVSRTLGR